jgi:hypothetical protein
MRKLTILLQRPDLRPPIIVVQKSTPSKLTPGYFFVTPSDGDNPGPHIFDNQGVRFFSSPLRTSTNEQDNKYDKIEKIKSNAS